MTALQQIMTITTTTNMNDVNDANRKRAIEEESLLDDDKQLQRQQPHPHPQPTKKQRRKDIQGRDVDDIGLSTSSSPSSSPRASSQSCPTTQEEQQHVHDYRPRCARFLAREAENEDAQRVCAFLSLHFGIMRDEDDENTHILQQRLRASLEKHSDAQQQLHERQQQGEVEEAQAQIDSADSFRLVEETIVSQQDDATSSSSSSSSREVPVAAPASVLLAGEAQAKTETGRTRAAGFMRRTSSLLPMLNQGPEATAALKQWLASFVGVPSEADIQDCIQVKTLVCRDAAVI